MSTPDEIPDKQVGVLKMTYARLFKEALAKGIYQAQAEKNANDMRETVTRIQREQGMSFDAAFGTALFQQLNQEKVGSIILNRVMSQMIEVIFNWLSEDGQRHATEEMKKLTVDEVFKEFK